MKVNNFLDAAEEIIGRNFNCYSFENDIYGKDIYIRIKIRTYRKSETHSFVEYTWKYDSEIIENNYEVTLEKFAKEVRELAEEINCAMRENLHI